MYRNFRRPPASSNVHRGFALFELVVVILILALMGAMAAPRISNAFRHQRLDFASRRVMADLRLVRSQAIRDQADRKIVFSTAGESYSLPEYTGPGAPYQVQLNSDPYVGVHLRSVSYTTPAEAVFSRLGLPQAGGTIVVGDGTEQVIITVSATTGQPNRVFLPEP